MDKGSRARLLSGLIESIMEGLAQISANKSKAVAHYEGLGRMGMGRMPIRPIESR